MTRLRPCIGLLAAALLWEAASRAAGTRALPPPGEIASAFASLVQNGTLPRALGLTLGHTGLGLGAAMVLGIPLGLWMGRSRAARALLTPAMELVRPLPPPALIPPTMLLLGFGPTLFAAVVGFAACFPLLLAAMDAGRAVPEALLDTARSLGASRLRLAARVVVPACLPGLATGLRMALPVALIVAVLAEMVGGDGAGRLILRLQRTWRIPEMYACVIGLGLTGWALAAMLSVLERRMLFWAPAHHRSTRRP
jgi:NitT/TauT family transport system permease protein